MNDERALTDSALSSYVVLRIEWAEKLIKQYIDEIQRLQGMIEWMREKNYITPVMKKRIDVLKRAEKNKNKLQFKKRKKQ